LYPYQVGGSYGKKKIWNGSLKFCLPKGNPLSLFLLSGFLLLAATAQAGGPIHGARAAGMGTAFIGLADDPSALLHNPAGIAQLTGAQIYGGVTLLSAASEYSSGQIEEDTLNQLYFPTHLYLVNHPPTSRLAFGLAFDSPFGIGGREWDQQGATRYLSTENSIATFAINPNLAIQLTSKLSLAMGLSYLRAEMRSVRMVDQSAFGAADGRSQLEANGDGWGTIWPCSIAAMISGELVRPIAVKSMSISAVT
jgi:long-subunit fatty acid transport protein